MTRPLPTITISDGKQFVIHVNHPRHAFERVTLNREQAQRVWECFAPYFDGREVNPVQIVEGLEE